MSFVTPTQDYAWTFIDSDSYEYDSEVTLPDGFTLDYIDELHALSNQYRRLGFYERWREVNKKINAMRPGYRPRGQPDPRALSSSSSVSSSDSSSDSDSDSDNGGEGSSRGTRKYSGRRRKQPKSKKPTKKQLKKARKKERKANQKREKNRKKTVETVRTVLHNRKSRHRGYGPTSDIPKQVKMPGHWETMASLEERNKKRVEDWGEREWLGHDHLLGWSRSEQLRVGHYLHEDLLRYEECLRIGREGFVEWIMVRLKQQKALKDDKRGLKGMKKCRDQKRWVISGDRYWIYVTKEGIGRLREIEEAGRDDPEPEVWMEYDQGCEEGRMHVDPALFVEGEVLDCRPVCKHCMEEGNGDWKAPQMKRATHQFTCTKHVSWMQEMPSKFNGVKIEYWEEKQHQGKGKTLQFHQIPGTNPYWVIIQGFWVCLHAETHMRFILNDEYTMDEETGRMVVPHEALYREMLRMDYPRVRDVKPMCKLCAMEGGKDQNPPKVTRNRHSFKCLKHKRNWTQRMPNMISTLYIDLWRPKVTDSTRLTDNLKRGNRTKRRNHQRRKNEQN
eukprot:TRINITY_DN50_c0_g1_i3.p1 TRINITY_DN50_c0_g1~~TRINITY_DN50_c0_g1_i3.p1  ORF type:complete len:559 (+),score=93.76 TRINITY_DN50_c0_g1_i3:1887-3563(+)